MLGVGRVCGVGDSGRGRRDDGGWEPGWVADFVERKEVFGHSGCAEGESGGDCAGVLEFYSRSAGVLGLSADGIARAGKERSPERESEGLSGD